MKLLKLGFTSPRVPSLLRRFLRSEDGGMLDYVLVVGVISLPLVMFLALFGTQVVKWVREQAPAIFNEAGSWLGG